MYEKLKNKKKKKEKKKKKKEAKNNNLCTTIYLHKSKAKLILTKIQVNRLTSFSCI